jgi:hypothetical protein
MQVFSNGKKISCKFVGKLVNFVRVLILCFSSRFFGEFVMGGESQKGSLNKVTGFSAIARCTGEPAYLKPISDYMQEPVEGLSASDTPTTIYTLNKGGIEKNHTKAHASFISQRSAIVA